MRQWASLPWKLRRRRIAWQAGVVLGEVGLRQVEAHQGELLAEARLAEVVPDGGEAALGGVEPAEAAADPRLEPGRVRRGWLSRQRR